jgi:D-alanyl-D-alanine carboxypeptidase (penicillin-binding protein 5/6)
MIGLNAIVRCLLVFLVAGTPIQAAAAEVRVPEPPPIAATSYLLIDAASEQILVEHQANTPQPPASLTKIMTSYVAAEEIDAGRLKMTDKVLISEYAWKQEGSRMFVQVGTEVAVEDLLRGIIIQSGNDATVAIAEHIGGSEDAFAEMMNKHARSLGLTGTHYVNSTGLPAEGHTTTAWDLAMLSKALINRHPDSYRMYAEKSFHWNNIDQPNRNRLLWRDRSVDGVKTGHTEEAGFCLVASASRDGMRLISVVMGTKDDNSRMDESQKLLSYGFRHHESRELYAADVVLKQAEIWYGESDTIDLGLTKAALVTYPRGHYEDLAVELEVPKILEAPLAAGAEVGTLRVSLQGTKLLEVPLVALSEVPESGAISRFFDYISLFFSELTGDD